MLRLELLCLSPTLFPQPSQRLLTRCSELGIQEHLGTSPVSAELHSSQSVILAEELAQGSRKKESAVLLLLPSSGKGHLQKAGKVNVH